MLCRPISDINRIQFTYSYINHALRNDFSSGQLSLPSSKLANYMWGRQWWWVRFNVCLIFDKFILISHACSHAVLAPLQFNEIVGKIVMKALFIKMWHLWKCCFKNRKVVADDFIVSLYAFKTVTRVLKDMSLCLFEAYLPWCNLMHNPWNIRPITTTVNIDLMCINQLMYECICLFVYVCQNSQCVIRRPFKVIFWHNYPGQRVDKLVAVSSVIRDPIGVCICKVSAGKHIHLTLETAYMYHIRPTVKLTSYLIF